MAEFKTLKDIEREDWNGIKGVYSEELKQEAIKWVRAMREELNNPNTFFGKGEGTIELPNGTLHEFDYECRDISAVILWICNFFNLTEEDLE
jgi:hypothetical protein